MRIFSPGMVGGGAALIAMLTLATTLAPAAAPGGPAKLASASIDLPADEAVFPDGPHADTVNSNCLACHSASMVLTQPRLNADQWKGIVEKMRDTYKAPVPDADVPNIVAYLAAMSAKLPDDAGR